MAGIEVKPIENKGVWEGFMANHPEANFLHSWYWGEFHEKLGHPVFRRGFYDGESLIGLLLGEVEPARRGRHMLIPGGPILDWRNPQLIKAWVDETKRIAKQEKCIFVRVRPQLVDSTAVQVLFQSLGFRRSPMHLTADLTNRIDLLKSDEELKKAMRKGTRYELNRTAKFGIKVEANAEGKFLDEFYDLQLQTAERQKFVPFSKKFLSEQFKAFAEPGKVLMYRATYKGKLLAMAFIIFYRQEAVYHYGASTDLAREYPGAYAIQWEAIHEARRRGCHYYNFWGVTGHHETKHRFYGASHFKRGFGGEDMAYLPAHDLAIDSMRYSATYLFETARRKLRKL